VARSDLRDLLNREHHQIEVLFEELIAACRADASDEVRRLWDAFDGALQSHFDLEEQHIFPEVSRVDPKEVAALVREHGQLRAKLLELGIGVDLHLIRTEAVVDFIAALKAHARREDALMYRWAQANLPEDAQARIRARTLGTSSKGLKNDVSTGTARRV
jgi:hemerythrin-like domain-containing protein